MKRKNLGLVTAMMLGGLLSTSVLAAPVDEVTMEVVDVDTQQTSDVTRQIEIPQALQQEERNRLRERHEYRSGAGTGGDESASGDMLREQTRERSELRDEQQSQSRDQVRDQTDAVKQETQDQLQDMQEVKQQLHQGMK